MTTSFLLSVDRSPLTMSYQLTVIHEASRIIANGKRTVNSKWLMVNGSTKGSV